ncbi:phosphotransferase family protein [Aspergillus melleus]|uniref:phosphotransferase family protein n=1 Tax=Aspergillus melleus TaxID=138277 RepID=UPI001E8D208A|nr:uncharacterized protein LDX57_001709 [Aspergillus melleus]KAH8423953.1 hypothetical protein LDX57_001709 [Aspergillus melleus]
MLDEVCRRDKNFAGYRWSYFSSLGDGPLRSRAERFLESIDWAALVRFVLAGRDGLECRLLPHIGLGQNHMVRVVEFADQVRWLARLRLPPLQESCAEARGTMESECRTMCFVQKESQIPVPRVHMIECDPDSSVGAQFMLMDCLRGNSGIDLSLSLPPEHKLDVYSSMAKIQIEMFNIRLRKIGKIVGINDDGSYRLGPLPTLGGPFDTAADFFRAWSTKVEFGLPEDQLQNAAGSYASEILSSMKTVKTLVHDNAERLSVYNEGPFPLCHGDFGHNNMVFDDEYHLLGVIDWETAYAGPCEMSGEFPLTISIVPPAMDVPWKYDEAGYPKEAENRQKLTDRDDYVAIVKQIEAERGLTDGYSLSSALQAAKRQYLATAMRLFQRGKPGWYSKVMESFNHDQIT